MSDYRFRFHYGPPERWRTASRVVGALLALTCIGFAVAAIWTGDGRYGGLAVLALALALALVVAFEIDIEATR